jgi:hypothetical protein
MQELIKFIKQNGGSLWDLKSCHVIGQFVRRRGLLDSSVLYLTRSMYFHGFMFEALLDKLLCCYQLLENRSLSQQVRSRNNLMQNIN